MRSIWLIAENFVREQRIVLMVFVGWIFGFVLFFGLFAGPATASEYQGLFQQQAIYGVVYGLIVALQTIHGERKSRRILAVLSKGIYRGEYIAGLMLGNALLTSIYMGCLGTVYMFVSWKFGMNASLWPTIGAAWLASILAGSIALFFGALLHPAMAAVGTSLVMGTPLLLERGLGPAASMLVPVNYVVKELLEYSFPRGWPGSWHFVPIAMLEIGLLWFLTAKIFARRDVTVAIE
ncbi:MAG: hypothetical protein JWO13_970 [Acidobacteriales bacterium]|nr:hypothetical protein [Terriglobales bacterium]